MKKVINKLPQQKLKPLYHFIAPAGFGATPASGDPTNTISSVLTTSHIWQK